MRTKEVEACEQAVEVSRGKEQGTDEVGNGPWLQ
jgi:hypothetical protein